MLSVVFFAWSFVGLGLVSTCKPAGLLARRAGKLGFQAQVGVVSKFAGRSDLRPVPAKALSLLVLSS